jgi:class 3 adenylate cyclase
MSILFAASYPEKVERLVLFGAMARFVGAEDYPHRPPLEVFIDDFVATWGKGALVPLMAPERGYEPGYPEMLARLERMSATPSAIRKFLLANERIDVRPILADVRLPTLVIHRRNDTAVARDNGHYLADNIPRAMYLELPGRSHLPWLGDSDMIVDALVHFAEAGQSGKVGEDLEQRRLATALFTDIAESTVQLATVGDQRWSEMLDRHDRLAQALVSDFRGRIVKNTGDGILALFDGPARSVRCAQRLIAELDGIGLAVRAGLHVGEVVQRGDDVTGLAINIAARVMEQAEAGEVLLTRTLMDLTGGSGIAFDPAGSHELKGIPGTFDLFRPAGKA